MCRCWKVWAVCLGLGIAGAPMARTADSGADASPLAVYPSLPGRRAGGASEQAVLSRTVDRAWELANGGRLDEALAIIGAMRRLVTDPGQAATLDAMVTVFNSLRETSPSPTLARTVDRVWEMADAGRLDEALAVLDAARRLSTDPVLAAKLDAMRTVCAALKEAPVGATPAAAQPVPVPPPPPVSMEIPAPIPYRAHVAPAPAVAAPPPPPLPEQRQTLAAPPPPPTPVETPRQPPPVHVSRHTDGHGNDAANDAQTAAAPTTRALAPATFERLLDNLWEMAGDGRFSEALAAVQTAKGQTVDSAQHTHLEAMRTTLETLAETAGSAVPMPNAQPSVPTSSAPPVRSPPASAPPAVRPAASAPVTEGLLQGGGSALSERLWADPRFREQFIGTYAMTAAVEPKVYEDERRLLALVFEMMAKKQSARALRIIERIHRPEPPALEDLGVMTVAVDKRRAAWEALAAAAAAEAAAATPAADSEPAPSMARGVRALFGGASADASSAKTAAPPSPAAAALAGATREPPPRTVLTSPSAAFAQIAGNICQQQADLAGAAQWYTVAVHAFPSFLRAHKNLGLVEVQRGNFATAIGSLTRAIELGAGDALLYGLLAYAHTNLGNHVAAEIGYRQAILLQPENADWKMGLARSLFGQSRFADAAAVCGNLLAERPEDATLWRLQAKAYLALGQTAKAAENYEYLRILGESDVESLTTLGDIYAKSEAWDAALDAYLAALASGGGQALDGYIQKAKMLARGSAVDAAVRLLAAIDQAAGGTLTAAQRKETLRIRAWLAVRDGADAEQARLLEEIVELDPTDGDALVSLAQHYARSGNPEKAIFIYERAAGIPTAEAKAKIGHAQVLVQQSKFDEAIPLLKSALLIQPRDDVAAYLKQVEAAALSRR